MVTSTSRRGLGPAVSLALAGALALAGCGSAETSSSGSGAQGGQVTVKYTAGAATVTDWDDYVAEAKGFYAANGITVDRIDTQTATAATQLLVTGEAEIGRGLPPAIQAVEASNGGVSLISTADILIRPPFVMVTNEITDWSQLQGRTVGVSSPTDSTGVITESALRFKGLPQGSVDLVPSGGTGSRYSALQGGALDATLLLPPVNFTATDAGFEEIGYLPEELGPDWQASFTSVIVNPDWAADNRPALVAFLRARDQALQWLNDPANREEAVAILAEATQVSPDVAGRTYDLLEIGTETSAFAPRIGVSQKASGQVLADLQALGQASPDLTVERFLDDSYAQEARGGS